MSITRNTIASRKLDELKDKYEEKYNKRLTNQELANILKISPAALCKRLNGDVLFQSDEIVEMARFFGISCDELLTGVSAKNNFINQEYGLNDKSLEWLKENTKNNKDYITLLNIILNDENIADALFRAMLIYCNSVMLKLMPLTSTKLNEYIYVNAETSDEIIKRIASDKIIKVLSLISTEWDNKMMYKIHTELSNTKNKYQISTRRKHKLLSLKKCLSDKDKRYYFKYKQKVTGFNIVEQFEKTDTSISKYMALKELLEKEISTTD